MHQCRNLRLCGGCNLIKHYEEQLKDKQSLINSLFPYSKEIIKTKEINYRNRMDFIANKKLSLRKKGKFNEFVEIDYCFLAEEAINQRIPIINEFLKNYDDFYNLKTHQGNLRYVVIRTNGKDCQINVVATKKSIAEDLAKEIIKKFPNDSIYESINDSLSDISSGKYLTFYNQEFLKMSYKDYNFLITPNVFFQTNLEGFHILAKIVEESVREIKPKVVVDLYSGIGVFGTIASRYSKNVLAIDINEENIRVGKINSELNNVSIEFIQEDARLWSKKFNQEADLFILDPPRPGLDKNTIKMLLSIKPKYILYISCNPKTQKENYDALKSDYKILFSQPIDMFPYTHHIENVILLQHNEI
ncbi:MAG: methyltransferase [Candidatus Woesearchaeota archaeon]